MLIKQHGARGPYQAKRGAIFSSPWPIFSNTMCFPWARLGPSWHVQQPRTGPCTGAEDMGSTTNHPDMSRDHPGTPTPLCARVRAHSLPYAHLPNDHESSREGLRRAHVLPNTCQRTQGDSSPGVCRQCIGLRCIGEPTSSHEVAEGIESARTKTAVR